MANISYSSIAVVGLKEPAEDFVKKLSKAMFDIDLDDIDVTKWGFHRCEGGKLVLTRRFVDPETKEERARRIELDGDYDASALVEGKFYEVEFDWNSEEPLGKTVRKIEEIDGKTWYQKIAHDKYLPLRILVPDEPFTTAGAAVPQFKVKTKWEPPYDELKKASEGFPELTFALTYFIDHDGPTGEIIVRGGEQLDEQLTDSFYLFDKIQYPRLPLLPRYMDLTLAQRGQAAVDTALEFVKQVQWILHDPRFTDSPYAPLRDQAKLAKTTKAIDRLVRSCEEAAKLTFDGVFLPDMTVE